MASSIAAKDSRAHSVQTPRHICHGRTLRLPSRAAADTAKLRVIVDQAIRPVVAEYALPGVAVAATIDDQPSFFNYGMASREHHTPVTEHTLFELGSISKTFTATLASYALATSKLSLDDHPGKYLPALKGCALGKASVLNLGTYNIDPSGLGTPLGRAVEGTHVGYFKIGGDGAGAGMGTISLPRFAEGPVGGELTDHDLGSQSGGGASAAVNAGVGDAVRQAPHALIEQMAALDAKD